MFTSGVITTIIGTTFVEGDRNPVLKSSALVAIGFLVRPFGGMFLGPLGDKVGYQRVPAMMIRLMPLCTILVGVLPPYKVISIAAPISSPALRLIQVFFTGDHYNGAATFIAEYVPAHKRGCYGRFFDFGPLTGYVFGNAMGLAIVLHAGSDAMWARGWRLPFLIALPLGTIGVYLGTRFRETSTFRYQDEIAERPDRVAFRECVTDNWKMLLNLIGIVLLLNVLDDMLVTTMLSCFTEHRHVGDNTSMLIILAPRRCRWPHSRPRGALSGRIGRTPLLLTASIGPPRSA